MDNMPITYSDGKEMLFRKQWIAAPTSQEQAALYSRLNLSMPSTNARRSRVLTSKLMDVSISLLCILWILTLNSFNRAPRTSRMQSYPRWAR